MTLHLPPDLARVLREVPELRRAYLVGGCVRDALRGAPVKDFDIEVFGVDYPTLAEALKPFGRVDLVGRSFGVVKVSLGGDVHDFSIPRRDSKTGPGHQGFEAALDPDISLPEAAARRDFTINSMLYDPREGALLDFFGGRRDLEQRCLRHTSPAYVEDPLRVLRGMQFAARFDLVPAPETISLSRQIAPAFGELAVERVREEWFKWAAHGLRPSAGLRFLEAAGWLKHFPEIQATLGVPQDPEWHPEGDVFTHTCHCLDALVRQPAWADADETTRVVTSLAVLLHDLGKAACTQTVEREGRLRIVSPGHEQESGRLATAFLERLRVPTVVRERVVPLVVQHMAHFQEPSDRAVRRLARRLAPETVENLCLVMTADAQGRPPRPATVPSGVRAIQDAAFRLQVSRAAPHPIVQGRHLLALGFRPGREVGTWTTAAFEAQLDGAFTDLRGAYAWLAEAPAFPETARVLARQQAVLPGR